MVMNFQDPGSYEGMVFSQQTACPVGTTGYIVKAGDTLFGIARRLGITIDAIIAANPGLNPNNLAVGQQICVPGAAPGPCPGGTAYVIRPGDTFYVLAARSGVSLAELLAANPGVDPTRLTVGQTICIPGAPVPPPLEVRIPCSTVLQPNFSVLPPGAEIPFGMVGVRAVSMSTRWYTFAAITLPEPGQLGNFDSYAGVLNVFVEGNPSQAATRVVRLVLSSFGDQPATWSGATITTERPMAGETAEIRPLNTTTGARGAAILRSDLGTCRG